MELLRDNNTIRLKPLHWIVLLGILQLLISFLAFYSGFSFDEAIWHYIGRNWFRHGLVPYTGGVDNKSPLIYMIYGLSDKIFGVNPWFPRLLAIACQCTGMYFVYRIAKQIADERTGMIAVILYGLSLLWRSVGGKMVSLTQVYETMFLIMSFWFFILGQNKKHFFVSGLFGGLAFCFRFSAGFSLLVIPLILLQKKSFPSLFIYLSGVISMILLQLGMFALAGIDINEFIHYAFSDNYTSGSITDRPFVWKLEQFADAFFYSELILFYPFVLIYLFLKKRAELFSDWLITSFVGVLVIGMFARTHLKELLPPLCIMSAVAVSYLMSQYRLPVRATLLILIICFFPKTFEPLLGIKKLITSHAPEPIPGCTQPYTDNEDYREQLGRWIKLNTSPGDTVYIAGNSAQAQVYSQRISASIYFNATPTTSAKKRLLSDLSICRPAIIVIPLFPQYVERVDAETRSFINRLVEKDYHLDACVYNYGIYRYNSNQ
jgi:4-amino-4-deoxy-L-arabinose transferase-like glycosyltransferase